MRLGNITRVSKREYNLRKTALTIVFLGTVSAAADFLGPAMSERLIPSITLPFENALSRQINTESQ